MKSKTRKHFFEIVVMAKNDCFDISTLKSEIPNVEPTTITMKLLLHLLKRLKFDSKRLKVLPLVLGHMNKESMEWEDTEAIIKSFTFDDSKQKAMEMMMDIKGLFQNNIEKVALLFTFDHAKYKAIKFLMEENGGIDEATLRQLIEPMSNEFHKKQSVVSVILLASQYNRSIENSQAQREPCRLNGTVSFESGS